MKKNVLACLLWAFLLSNWLIASPSKGAMFEVLQLDPYPVITNRYVRDYNGDSVVHATSNGLPAIIALPGQDINRLLGALGLTREKFAEFNDLSPMVLTRLKPGAVYYLKAKLTKAPIDFHIVQFKEDLWDVSQRYGIRKSALLSRNRLTGDALAPGTKLFLNSKRSKKQALEVIKLPDPGPNAPGPWDALLREIRPQTVATANPGANPVGMRQPIRPPLRYANNPRVRVHTVKENESLFTISQLYNTTILDLKNWNDLQSASVAPNDQLVVNGGELAQSGIGQPSPTNPAVTQPGITVNNPAVPNPNTPATTMPFNQPATATADKMHTVERGETVYSIARKYNVSAKDLMLWNGFDNNTVLNMGQTVVVKNQPVSTMPATGLGSVPTSPVLVQEVPVNPQTAFQQAAVDTAKQIRTGIYALDPPGITTFNMTAPANSQVATQPVNPQQPAVTNPGLTNPAVGPTNPTAPVLTNGYYVVQKNEDIFAVSKKFNIPVTSLRQWNNLAATTPLVEGQSLLVRDPFAAPNNPSPTTIGSSPASRDVNTGVNNQVVAYRPKPGEKPKKHVVEAKETLFALSKKYGKTVEELKAYNGLPNDQISIGQELIVGYTAAPATKKATKKSNKETGSVVLAGGLPVNNSLPPDQLGTSFGISQAASGEESAYYQIAAPATKIIGATPPATTELDKPATTTAPANATYHEVAKGESLYSISRKYNVSIKEILGLNNMKDNDVIVVGQKLRVK